MDEAIISHLRLKHSLLLGQQSAEEVKISIGSVFQTKEEKHTVVRGRDLESGLPKSIKLSSSEVREALASVANQIIEAIDEVVEEIPPELVSDIFEQGITLAGGGALIRGIDKLIAEETRMPVWVVDDPLEAVVRGAGMALDDDKLLERVKVTGGLK